MPGIRSLSAFELPTNSFYAMSAAIQRFQAIGYMRGGRISGFLGREGTTFFFSKTPREVPHIDETGRSVRVKQWIVELEAPVDVTALLREEENVESALAQADFSVGVLTGETGQSAQEDPARHPGFPTMEQIASLLGNMSIDSAAMPMPAGGRAGGSIRRGDAGCGMTLTVTVTTPKATPTRSTRLVAQQLEKRRKQ